MPEDGQHHGVPMAALGSVGSAVGCTTLALLGLGVSSVVCILRDGFPGDFW